MHASHHSDKESLTCHCDCPTGHERVLWQKHSDGPDRQRACRRIAGEPDRRIARPRSQRTRTLHCHVRRPRAHRRETCPHALEH